MRRPAVVWTFILGAVAALLAFPAPGGAQVAGTISGIVRPGAGSEVATSGVLVELVELREGPTVVQETRTTAGRFRFEVERVDPSITYVVRATVDGVGYLPQSPIQLSVQRPAAQVDIAVYGATTQRPELSAEISALTIVGVDRAAGTLTLQREDAVLNPSTRTWTGDADGVTVRLPALPRTLQAEGQAWFNGLPTAGDLTSSPDGIVAHVPLRPGQTMLITRYTVEADLAAAAYELRNEAALPTKQLQVMVPEHFARSVSPLRDALEAEPVEVEGQRLLVVERSRAAQAGDVVAASVTGLAAPIPAHPFTQPLGAASGAALVAGFAAAAGVVAMRRGARVATA